MGDIPLSERAQRHNLRDMAAKAQRASERAVNVLAGKDADFALREAYADGVEDVLLYIAGDAAPSTWLADILNADERDEPCYCSNTPHNVGGDHYQ